MAKHVYHALFDLAVDQHGFVTVDDVRELGFSGKRLVDMSQRGLAERVSAGVYRLKAVPAGRLDQYMACALWPRPARGVLSHATALDLHELCDVNPARIDVTVPAGYRTNRQPPGVLRLHREHLPDEDVTWMEVAPIVNVRRAITGGIEQGVGWNLIEQAIGTARGRGKLTKAQARELARMRPVTEAASA